MASNWIEFFMIIASLAFVLAAAFVVRERSINGLTKHIKFGWIAVAGSLAVYVVLALCNEVYK